MNFGNLPEPNTPLIYSVSSLSGTAVCSSMSGSSNRLEIVFRLSLDCVVGLLCSARLPIDFLRPSLAKLQF